jgi:hypothetical protein
VAVPVLTSDTWKLTTKDKEKQELAGMYFLYLNERN